MSRKVLCREQRKRGQEMKGCLGTVGKGAALGRLRVTLTPAFFHCLAASPLKERSLLVLAAASPLWAPGHHWSLAQEQWSITYRSSSAPRHSVPRWSVMPQGHSLSPHKTRISRANLSSSLSNSTLFHVLRSIPCPLLSSPSTASITQCQLEATSSRWGDNTEGGFSNWSLQEPLGCCWEEGALWRPFHTIAYAAEPCGWASACQKTNHLRVKGPLGHWSSWDKCGDATPCRHCGSQGEGNAKVLSPQRAAIQSEPLGAWTWKSALAVPEIGHVTRRMAGDSPSLMSQCKLTVSLPFSKFSWFGW